MSARLPLRIGAWSLTLLIAAGGARVRAESPVADAAMRGETDRVRALLRGGADVNAPQGDGMTALHWAARNGDAEEGCLVSCLLQLGAVDHDAMLRTVVPADPDAGGA